MKHKRWKITGTFTLLSPLHVGSGAVRTDRLPEKNGVRCEVQSVVVGVVDKAQRPCLPGSALKGVLRSWAEAFYPGSNAVIERIFGTPDASAANAHAGWADFLNLFAEIPASDQAGRFSKYVPYWDNSRVTGVYSNVCLNREHGVAQENKLFFQEFVPEGVRFPVQIEATRLSDSEITLLLAVLEHGANHPTHPYQFGANSADGWGRVEWKLGLVQYCVSKPTTVSGVGFDCCRQTWTVPVLPLPSNPSREYVAVNVALSFNGPFLVNDTSKTHQKENDNLPHFVAMKRADGQVWLPASSFRGALRSRFEFLAKSKRFSEKVAQEVFGHTGQAARLQIHEITQTDDTRELQHQDFVAIDRFTGGASDSAKFHANYADRPTFTIKLIFDDGKLSEEAKQLLAATFHDLQQGKIGFGFGTSKGYGEAIGTLCDAGRQWVNQHIGEAERSETGNSSLTQGVSLTQDVLQIEEPKPGIFKKYLKSRRTDAKGSLTPAPWAQLSKDLQDLKQLGEFPVEYELEKNQPVRIRFVGKGYIPVLSAAAATTAARPSVDTDRFAHPYYFLPFQDREKFSGDLADDKPVGHDQYKRGTYSGRLRVKLMTVTPLLICDQPVDPNAEHKTYPVLVDDRSKPVAKQKPLLASSSVRGTLRSAYEAITNSRFGVFPIDSDKGHQNRLAYRRQAQVDVEPAYVESVSPDLVQLRILSQLWQNSPAKLPRYQLRPNAQHLRDKGQSQAALRYPDNSLPVHGDRVYVQVVGNGQVTEIRRHQAQSPGPGWLEGFVLLTGANINSKKYERVFVISNSDKTLSLKGDKARELQSLWTELIANYQNEHERDLEKRTAQNQSPSEYFGPEPGKTAWSRHVIEPGMRNLQAGMCVYLKRTPQRITDIYPVSISRKLYDRSPLQATPPKLLPARTIDELSPADRVFGWVSQDPNTGANPAYRSHVRIGVVKCLTENAIANEQKTLAILGQPKPAQGRFYLSNKDGNRQPLGGTKEQSGYTGTNRIRGPKVYPHHAAGFDQRTAYAIPDKSQNRTVKGYVKPKSEFEFDLHFENLRAFELGALLWLLTLDEGHYLRIGLGKPLGFGSVTAQIDWKNSVMALGEEWIKVIGTANEPSSTTNWRTLKEGFEEVMTKANPNLLKAFLIACKGWKDLATHYPRLNTQPPGSGEHYRWFVENDRVNGPGHSLPDLTDNPPSLPYLG